MTQIISTSLTPWSDLPKEIVKIIASYDKEPNSIVSLRSVTKMFHQFLSVESIIHTQFFYSLCSEEVASISKFVKLICLEEENSTTSKAELLCKTFLNQANEPAKQHFWHCCAKQNPSTLFPLLASCPEGFYSLQITSDVEEGITLFNLCPGICKLTLQTKSPLSSETVSTVYNALKSHTSLEVLDLGPIASINLTAIDWTNFRSLRSLTFSYEKQMSNQLMELLEKQFLRHFPQLEKLKLAVHQALPDTFPNPEQLKTLKQLRSLDCGGLRLSGKTAEMLSELPIEELSVDWFTIDALFQLRKLQQLKKLRISVESTYNHELFCDSLRELTNLQQLHVSSSYAGLSYDIYADFATCCSRLQELTISDTELDTKENATRLAEAIKNHPNLKRVSLNLYNPPEYLFKAIRENPNLSREKEEHIFLVFENEVT